MHGRLPPGSFRDYIIDKMNLERGLMSGGQPVLSQEEIDGALYNLLPLFPRNQLNENVTSTVDKLPGITPEIKTTMTQLLEEYGSSPGNRSLVSAQGLQDIVLALLIVALGKTSTTENYAAAIARISQEKGLAMPAPILVADSNWVRDWFGFVVNPGTEKFELWRIDQTGRIGRPINAWKQWLDGSRKDITWGIFSQPFEYRT